MTSDKLVLPEGMQRINRAMSPPNKTGFFGWIDDGGDPNSFKWDSIMGAHRAPNGRYYIYVQGLASPIQLPADDFFRLLKRMGWEEKSMIGAA